MFSKLKLWERKFDVFNDVYYWQHQISGIISDNCPSLQDLVDGDWTYPELSLRLSGRMTTSKTSKTNDVSRREGKLEAETLSAAMNILRRRKASLENQTISVDKKV